MSHIECVHAQSHALVTPSGSPVESVESLIYRSGFKPTGIIALVQAWRRLTESAAKARAADRRRPGLRHSCSYAT